MVEVKYEFGFGRLFQLDICRRSPSGIHLQLHITKKPIVLFLLLMSSVQIEPANPVIPQFHLMDVFSFRVSFVLRDLYLKYL